MHLVPLSLQMWKQVCEGALSSSLALGLHEMQSGSRLITPVHGHAQVRHTHRPLLWPYMIILKQFTSLKGMGRGSDACLQGRGGAAWSCPSSRRERKVSWEQHFPDKAARACSRCASPRAFAESSAPLAPRPLTSGLRNCEGMFLFFKAPTFGTLLGRP